MNIFASQMYSKKIQDKMSSQLLKHKELKQGENKKLWKSYVKFLGVLMVTSGIRFMETIITDYSCCCQNEIATLPDS